jgi:hypothetical protein
MVPPVGAPAINNDDADVPVPETAGASIYVKYVVADNVVS